MLRVSAQRAAAAAREEESGEPQASSSSTNSGSPPPQQRQQQQQQQPQPVRGQEQGATTTLLSSAPKRVRASRNKQAGKAPATPEAYDHFHALPEYLRDNEYIKRYYRRSMPVRDSIKSLFGLHNETGNIYTHLLGFILFLCLTIYVAREPPTPLAMGAKQVDLLWHSAHSKLQQLRGQLPDLHALQGSLQHLQGSLTEKMQHMQEGLSESMHHLQEELSETVQHFQEGLSEGVHWIHDGIMPKRPQDDPDQSQEGGAVHSHLVEAMSGVLSWPTARWPTYVFMAGAMICLLLSSTCHLLGCCQKHISQFIWRLDYAGIATLIVSSFYPPVYYGFMCHPFYLAFYLITTTALGAMAVLVSLLDRFQKREWRYFRASMFSGLGLYGIAPVVHQWFLNSDVPQVRTALVYDLIMGATYLSGGAIYALRCPERWFPGRFDLFLHSHQIFHIAVVAGACIHYYSVKLMLEWRDASGGCAAPVTSGPVSAVLQQMRELGHELFSIDEVWGRLQHYMTQHVGAMEQQ